jgi:hypothetical protein
MKLKIFLLTLMNRTEVDDPQFDFLAGILAFYCNRDELTDKQRRYVDKYIDRNIDLWKKICKEVDNGK